MPRDDQWMNDRTKDGSVTQPFSAELSQTSSPSSTSWSELPPTLEEVEAIAMLDELTGMFNCRYWLRRFSYEMHRAGYFGRTVALMVVVVDNYERLGLEYGPSALDCAMKTLAMLLRPAVTGVDMIGRIAEDKLAVVLPEIAADDLDALANIICQACQRLEVKHQWQSFHLPVSIGIAVSTPEQSDAESMLELANRNASRASHTGGNQVCFQR